MEAACGTTGDGPPLLAQGRGAGAKCYGWLTDDDDDDDDDEDDDDDDVGVDDDDGDDELNGCLFWLCSGSLSLLSSA